MAKRYFNRKTGLSIFPREYTVNDIFVRQGKTPSKNALRQTLNQSSAKRQVVNWSNNLDQKTRGTARPFTHHIMMTMVYSGWTKQALIDAMMPRALGDQPPGTPADWNRLVYVPGDNLKLMHTQHLLAFRKSSPQKDVTSQAILTHAFEIWWASLIELARQHRVETDEIANRGGGQGHWAYHHSDRQQMRNVRRRYGEYEPEGPDTYDLTGNEVIDIDSD